MTRLYTVCLAATLLACLDACETSLRSTKGATDIVGLVAGTQALADESSGRAEMARLEALGHLEPTAVAPADRASYFDVVRRSARHGPPTSPEPRDPDPECVRKMLWLDRVVGASDPKLAADIRKWLFRQAGDFAQEYANEADKVLASPPGSPWHQAEAAWVAWLSPHLATLTDGEAYALAQSVLAGAPQGVTAFPGLDRLAFGLAMADLWAREGHPSLKNRDHPGVDSVLCSVQTQSRHLESHCNESTDHAWYRDVLATDADAHRLAKAVLDRRDPFLTRAVALGIGTTPKTLTVLRAWEASPEVWRDAVVAISRVEDWSWKQSSLVPELRRVWRSHPEWHGVILYALAQFALPYPEHYDGPSDRFTHFARDFGGSVTRADFDAFLDQAPRSLDLAVWVLPARTRGWSVADAVLPRLDAYLALAKDVPEGSPPGPGLGILVGYLCADDFDPAGWAKLRAYFDKRAPSHPGDPTNRITDLGRYAPKRCSRGS